MNINEAFKFLHISITKEEIKIKKAFRTLSKKYHPDKGGNDSLFNKLQDAYNLALDYSKGKINNSTQYKRPNPKMFPGMAYFKKVVYSKEKKAYGVIIEFYNCAAFYVHLNSYPFYDKVYFPESKNFMFTYWIPQDDLLRHNMKATFGAYDYLKNLILDKTIKFSKKPLGFWKKMGL